jgi:hypothetical protein
MTTGIVTVPLNSTEIAALVEALQHHAFVHRRWLLSSGRGNLESIEGILDICGIILRLQDLSGNCDEDFNLPPMIFRDSETCMVKRAIDLYTTVCEQRGKSGWKCVHGEYAKDPVLLKSILPRLDANWTQTSGHIPSDIPGEPDTIWIR